MTTLQHTVRIFEEAYDGQHYEAEARIKIVPSGDVQLCVKLSDGQWVALDLAKGMPLSRDLLRSLSGDFR